MTAVSDIISNQNEQKWKYSPIQLGTTITLPTANET
jgi:hypothetical protein